MDNHKVDFFIQAAILDKYIKLENPADDSVAIGVVIKRVKESQDLQRYFFGQNPSPEWALILYENGFFDSPPGVVKTDVGYQIPPWQLSSYLANVATIVPSVVDKVVNEIYTNNPAIHTDLIKALIKIPASFAARHTSKVVSWIENEYTVWGIAEATPNFVFHLAKNNFISEAMELLRTILLPIPSEAKKYDDFYLGGYAKPRFDLSNLRPDFWSETIPKLGKIAPKEVINVLEKSLLSSIRYEIRAKGLEYRNDVWLTYGWRASIGDSSQDSNDNYKDKLLVSLRDVFDAWIGRDPITAQPLLEDYLGRDDVIFRKIAIFLIATHSSNYLVIKSSLLLDQALHRNLKTINEYFRLLSGTFPNLSLDEKQSVLAIILEGPDPIRTEEIADRVSSERGVDRGEYAKRYHDTWIRDRLWVIRSSLPDDLNQKLNEYCEHYDTPEHPEFLIWSTGSEGYRIKDISPLSKEDLAEMPPLSLLEFLKTWEPEPLREFGPEEITLSGLAGVTASLIMESPDRYKELFNKLTEAPPAISAAVLSMAREHCKEKISIPWRDLLVLAYRNGNDIYTQNPGNWKEDNHMARIASIWFIHEALSTKDALPLEYLSVVEDIILIYLQDSDPDELRDNPTEDWIGHEDPITLAVNSIRPIALISLMLTIEIRLNEWNKEIHRDNKDKELTFRELLPQKIIKALDTKLDKTEDTSWGLHSVFGQFIWLLSKIDWIWFKDRIQAIFPTSVSDNNDRFFIAAWEAYVIWNKANRDLLDALRSQYFHAIHFLSEGKTTKTHLDYVSRLANHLLVDYLLKPYELVGKEGETQPLGLLFSLCNQNIRGHTIWTLWRTVKSISKDDLQRYWPHIKTFWKWRLNEASLSTFPEEFRNEMEELSHLPSLAPLSESMSSLWPFLDSLIPYADNYRVWRNLEEFLAVRVKDSPEKSINFYLLMHEEAPQSEYGYHSYGEVSDTILNTAVQNPSSRRNAKKVMDIIFRRGDDRYIDKYNL